MRGKENLTIAGLEDVGITPAYAGKSIFFHPFNIYGWDHPRVCGEKSADVGADVLYSGSPPRMRGKGFFCASAELYSRITPAYAGKREDQIHQHHAEKDHPRVCGEKVVNVYNFVFYQGSPPRMRGKGKIVESLKV